MNHDDLLQLVASAGEPVAVHDGDGRIVAHNDALRKLYGLDADESLVGQNELDWVSPEDRPAVLARIRQLMATGFQPAALETIVTRVGRQRVLVLASRFPDMGLILVRFVPLPEEASDWLHDLKNLLCLMLWSLDMRDTLDAEEVSTLRKVVDEAVSMTASFLARANDWQTTSPASLFEGVIKLAGLNSRRVVLGKVPDVTFSGDVSGLTMALLNLVVNAVEHGLRGKNSKGWIELSAVVVNASEVEIPETCKIDGLYELLHIRVANTGASLDGRALQKVQAKLDGLDTLAGRGLGLPHVGRIARRHNGWASVVSVPDFGTCFSIFIPLTPGEERF